MKSLNQGGKIKGWIAVFLAFVFLAGLIRLATAQVAVTNSAGGVTSQDKARPDYQTPVYVGIWTPVPTMTWTPRGTLTPSNTPTNTFTPNLTATITFTPTFTNTPGLSNTPNNVIVILTNTPVCAVCTGTPTMTATPNNPYAYLLNAVTGLYDVPLDAAPSLTITPGHQAVHDSELQRSLLGLQQFYPSATSTSTGTLTPTATPTPFGFQIKSFDILASGGVTFFVPNGKTSNGWACECYASIANNGSQTLTGYPIVGLPVKGANGQAQVSTNMSSVAFADVKNQVTGILNGVSNGLFIVPNTTPGPTQTQVWTCVFLAFTNFSSIPEKYRYLFAPGYDVAHGFRIYWTAFKVNGMKTIYKPTFVRSLS